MILNIVLIYLVCLIISCWRAYYAFGRKHEPDVWYDSILLAPMLATITILCAPRDFWYWWKHTWPYGKPRQARGRVEKVSYTWGAGGNQWTTILGVKYATFWNVHTKDWEIGQVVDFEVYWDRLHLGHNQHKRVLHARNITKSQS